MISVLIPHAGATPELERCLSALSGDESEDVVVVLPSWAEESRALIERRPNARPVVTEELLTFAQAINLAAGQARHDKLLLLNDDTVPQSGALRLLAEAVSRDPVVVAGPRLENVDGSIQYSVYADPSWRTLLEVLSQPLSHLGPAASRARFPLPRLPETVPPGHWLSGAALMVRRDVFRELGGLDEGYPHGLEDADFCRVVQESGRRLAVVAEARIVHAQGSSGFRHATDPGKVADALLRGTRGWLHYWRVRRQSGPAGMAMVRIAFGIHGLARLLATGCAAVVVKRLRVRSQASLLYLRALTRLSPREA